MRISILVALLVGCGSSPGTGSAGDAGTTDSPASVQGTVFDPAIANVVIEIDYEHGQEPYTGPILGFGDTFDTVTTNIDRLFAHHKNLSIPRVLGDMEDIGDVPDEEITADDILALAAAHRSQHDTASTKSYYLIFLSGHFADGTGVQSGVIGVSIGNTGVIAMFKDVVRSTAVIGVPNVERYVEQSTMTHELGHGVGLVDNGVHMTTNHRDAPHGAHCTNDQCTMYWLNEGAADAAKFAQKKVLSGTSILFGKECLDDVDAVNGGP